MRLIKQLVAVLLLAALACQSFGASKYWYFKYFSTGGTINPFYTNDNDWGYTNSTGSGFVEMVMGEDWGTISPYHPIPLVCSSVPSNATIQFSENHHVNSGGRIDSTWDNFALPYVETNAQGSEVMIWMNYTNTQPLSSSYNSKGQANPIYTNLSLAGRTWNVYYYNWGNGYVTVTFIDQNQTGSETLNWKTIQNWVTGKGYFPNSWTLMEIGAGWEFANGSATATYYNNTNF